MRFFLCLVVCLLGFWPTALEAQPDTLGLRLLAEPAGGQIRLRWSPDDYAAWQLCQGSGYIVERLCLAKDGRIVPYGSSDYARVLTPVPLRPWPEVRWAELVQGDDYAAVAAQALFGERFAGSAGQPGPGELQALRDEQRDRFSMAMFAATQSVPTAQALALYFEDDSAEPGALYQYRVYPAAPLPLPVDTASFSISLADPLLLPKPTFLRAGFKDRAVMLEWEKAPDDSYVAWEIWRSADGGQQFERVNALPVFAEAYSPAAPRQFYLDSLPQNAQVYVYQVRGRSALGTAGPFSDMVQGVGLPAPLANAPFFDDYEELDGPQVRLHWLMEAGDAEEGLLQGFQLYRSAQRERGYVPVGEALPPDARFALDPAPGAYNYYKIRALDRYGRYVESGQVFVQLSDTLPPAAPQGLKGRIDAEGVLTLTWLPNAEEDLLGYRVFFSNSEAGDYARLTPRYEPANRFGDTLRLDVLDEAIWYKVVALDLRQNVSAFSAPLRLERPDRVPPAAPRIVSIVASPEGVGLEWAASSSADVARHVLERRIGGQAIWESVQVLPNAPAVQRSKDATGDARLSYDYRIMAYDDDGLRTSSNVVSAKPIDTGIRAAIEGLRGEADRLAKCVRLNWQYALDAELSHFLIYRAAEGEALRQYAALPAEALLEVGKKPRRGLYRFEFQDKTPQMNTRYRYAVKAVYAREAASPMSGEIEVAY